MNSLAWIALGAILALSAAKLLDVFWSFRAQKLDDYAAATSPGDLAQILGRRFDAHGVIFDYSGRAKSRFTASIEGDFTAEGGTLKERFVYGSGAADRREWTIRFAADGKRFTATAPDVIGEAEGELRGDAIAMTYRLRLPERAGGHVLDVVDWLYLMPDGAIVNRSEMRKYGVLAAELMAVFTPVDGASERKEAAE